MDQPSSMPFDPEDRFVGIGSRHSGIIRPGVNAAPPEASRKQPRNVKYFSPDPDSFDYPEDAEALRALYADEKDGIIYRLPIWLSDDNLQTVIPHGLFFFGKSGVKCRSIIAGDKMLGISWDEKTKTQVQKDCVPERCQNYLTRKCKFSGRLYFHVPGHLSPNPLMLPTTSLNSFRLIVSALTSVSRFRGSFTALHNGQPFLELVKVNKEVLHRTDDGKLQHMHQWLSTIRCTVDPLELTATSTHRLVTISVPPLQPSASPMELSGDEPQPSAPAQPASTETATPAPASAGKKPVASTATTAPEGAPPATATEPAPRASTTGKLGTSDTNTGAPPISGEVNKLKQAIAEKLKSKGYTVEQLQKWALRITGNAKINDVPTLKAIERMLDSSSPRLAIEFRFAELLHTLDLSLKQFDVWCALQLGTPFDNIVSGSQALDVFTALKARTDQDASGFRAEILATKEGSA